MKNFQDLRAFQAAVDLMVEVYSTTNAFPAQERYGLASQLRRAAVSIVTNIAEGQGRLTLGEWRQLLSHARGSLFEIDALSIASHKLRLLPDEAFAKVRDKMKKTASPLTGLIRYVQRREEEAKRKFRQPSTVNRQPDTLTK